MSHIARRRRHAHLVATATRMIAECGEAAAAVYEPIADAPPGAEVPVSLWPIKLLAVSAPARLDEARRLDTARYPDEADREAAEDRDTQARRSAILEAERVVQDAVDGPPHPTEPATDAIPLPTTSQMAAMGPAAAGGDLLAALADDLEEGHAFLKDLTTDGEYTGGQLLNEAMATAVATACLALRSASESDDPSTAAETALEAARQLALVVRVASVDVRSPAA